jgi:hypothetical protein
LAKFKADAEKLSNFVEMKLNEAGYSYPTAEYITSIPQEEKVFTGDISILTQDELLKWLSTFTALFSSAAVDEAKYASQVATLKRDLESARANAFLMSYMERIGERERDAEVHPDVVDIQEKLSMADTFLSKLTALKKSYEQYSFLFSRAITILSEEKRLG